MEELRDDPVETPVLLLEPPYVTDEIRLKINGHIAQTLFETLLVPAIFLTPRTSLAGPQNLWGGINALCQQLGDGDWLTRNEYSRYGETKFASHHAAMTIEQIRAKLVKMGIVITKIYRGV